MFFVWLLPLLAGALDAAARGIIKATKVHAFTLSVGGFLFTAPFYIVWLIIEGMPDIAPEFWRVVALHVPLLSLASILTIEAHRRSPLILTIPYLSFTPAFLLITAPLMGGGNPTFLGGVGVAIITIGLYVLNIHEHQVHHFAPLKAFLKERGSQMMLVVALLFSIPALRAANAPFYLLVDHGLVAVVMLILMSVYITLGKEHKLSFSPKGFWKALAGFGILIGVASILHMLAFAWIPIVPYVIAAKRSGSIIFTVLLGIIIAYLIRHKEFMRERENLKYRIPGTLIMVLGMVIILLWGSA
jgi:hypothetical protein